MQYQDRSQVVNPASKIKPNNKKIVSWLVDYTSDVVTV